MILIYSYVLLCDLLNNSFKLISGWFCIRKYLVKIHIIWTSPNSAYSHAGILQNFSSGEYDDILWWRFNIFLFLALIFLWFKARCCSKEQISSVVPTDEANPLAYKVDKSLNSFHFIYMNLYLFLKFSGEPYLSSI